MRVALLVHLFLAVVFGSESSSGTESDHGTAASLRGNQKSSIGKEDHDFFQRFLMDGAEGSMMTGPMPPPTPFPSLPPEEQDKFVTCISVIDENDSKNVEDDWNELRMGEFRDRPFCLLRPIPPGAGGGLSFPTTFFTDPRNIFANVTRDSADVSNPSDWYNICNLDAGKPQGLTRVVLFVDNSGSMTTSSVQNAFDLFAQRVVENGFQIVTAVENASEDYIDPCLLTSVLPPTPPPVTSAPVAPPPPPPVSMPVAMPNPMPAPTQCVSIGTGPPGSFCTSDIECCSGVCNILSFSPFGGECQ